ncbi:MAG: sigma-54-dependent Fis family transcriptional regulator [Desulfomonilia bacterium]
MKSPYPMGAADSPEIPVREINVDRARLKNAWERFVSEGEIIRGVIRPEILESWQRSRDRGIDPYTNTVPCDISEDEKNSILAENTLLIETARPILQSLFHLIKSLDIAVFLTNQDCIILDALGEGGIWEYCKASNAVVGGSFHESICGPTAPGIALSLDRPYQMVCEEHYLIGMHMASCAAAPIHDEFNQAIGCIDITTSYETALKHPHTLGMIAACAQLIEKQLRLSKELEKTFVAGQYLRAAMEAMTEGLIILDKDNRITLANKAAEFMLGFPDGILSGIDIQCIIRNDSVLHALMNNIRLTDHELILEESENTGRSLVTLIPIVDQDANKMGSLLIFRPLKELQKLMKHMVGLEAPYTFSHIWGRSPKLRETIELAKRVAGTDVNVIIVGESGTGKEMIAQSIHNMGPFSRGPFLAVNCSAIPNDLIESELFGYEAGTFTGALRSGKPGRFELANGGTLFLDEVNGMSLDMQAKLLRVLEEKRFQRLGGHHYIPLEARVIAASNKNLEEEVKKGHFRSDLLYRLNVVEICMPPLRERVEDIEFLVEKLIQEISRRLGKKIKGISPDALTYLAKQPWPGNVRQLKNWVERAVTLTRNSVLTVRDFSVESVPRQVEPTGHDDKPSDQESSRKASRLRDMEKNAIQTVVNECKGNLSLASKKLGVSRATLYRKMKRFDLTVHKSVSGVS